MNESINNTKIVLLQILKAGYNTLPNPSFIQEGDDHNCLQIPILYMLIHFFFTLYLSVCYSLFFLGLSWLHCPLSVKVSKRYFLITCPRYLSFLFLVRSIHFLFVSIFVKMSTLLPRSVLRIFSNLLPNYREEIVPHSLPFRRPNITWNSSNPSFFFLWWNFPVA